MLADAGLPPSSRVLLEKPFGEDLKCARALNALLTRTLGEDTGQTVFQVDHVLGMAPLQNLFGQRFAHRITQAVWNSEHIEQMDVLREETLDPPKYPSARRSGARWAATVQRLCRRGPAAIPPGSP